MNYEKMIDQRLKEALKNTAPDLDADCTVSVGAADSIIGMGSADSAKSPEQMDSLQFLQWVEAGAQLAEERKEKEMSRRGIDRRYFEMAVAALVCLAIGAGSLLALNLLPAEETHAGPGESGETVVENGIVIIGSDGTHGDEVWARTVSAFDEIPKVYQKYVVLPESVPAEFIPGQITLNIDAAFIEIKIEYIRENDFLEITELYYQSKQIPETILYGYEEVKLKEKTAYCKEINGRLHYAVFSDKLRLEVNASNRLSEEEIIQILESIKIDWSMM